MNRIILPLLIILLSFNAFAGVNLKNGNFYVSYTDIQIKDSNWMSLEMTRTYNSKSVYYGSLGFGWGHLFDTYLVVSPDNSIAIRNHGSGGTYYFESELTNEETIQTTIEHIINAAKDAGRVTTPEDEVKLVNKLKINMAARFSEFEKYRKLGKIDTLDHNTGLTYYSLGCGCIGEVKPGYSYIVSTDDGYIYYDYKLNRINSFNKLGKLTGIQSIDNPDYSMTITYSSKKNIDKVTSYTGDWLEFKYDTLNRIVEIGSNKDDKTAKYWYDGVKMKLSKDIYSNYKKYEYDKAYNMTRIVVNPVRVKGYPEEARYMSYESGTYFISRIVELDSTFTTYEYLSVSDDEYGTNEKSYSKDSTLLNDYTEWWFIKPNDHGNRWTYKKIYVINGDSLVKEYHEVSKKPLIVINSDGQYDFIYDPTGLLISAENPFGDIMMVSYDDKKDINVVSFKGNDFILQKSDTGYSAIVLPNNVQVDLPLNDIEAPEYGMFSNDLNEIKKLFELSDFYIL